MPKMAIDKAGALIRRLALVIGVVGFAATFAVFIYSIAARHLFDQPQTWADEVVSIANTWLVFWTSAFVLKWSDFIAFDVMYKQVPKSTRRWIVLSGALIFLTVIIASLWYVVDFVMFMAISTTDMLRIPLDYVYAIFVVFLIVICVRLVIFCLRLIFGNAETVLAELESLPSGADR